MLLTRRDGPTIFNASLRRMLMCLSFLREDVPKKNWTSYCDAVTVTDNFPVIVPKGFSGFA